MQTLEQLKAMIRSTVAKLSDRQTPDLVTSLLPYIQRTIDQTHGFSATYTLLSNAPGPRGRTLLYRVQDPEKASRLILHTSQNDHVKCNSFVLRITKESPTTLGLEFLEDVITLSVKVSPGEFRAEGI